VANLYGCVSADTFSTETFCGITSSRPYKNAIHALHHDIKTKRREQEEQEENKQKEKEKTNDNNQKKKKTTSE